MSRRVILFTSNVEVDVAIINDEEIQFKGIWFKKI